MFSNYSMGSLTKIVQVFFLSPLYISPFATEFCGTFKPESTRKKSLVSLRNSQVCLLLCYGTKMGKKTLLDYKPEISKCLFVLAVAQFSRKDRG